MNKSQLFKLANQVEQEGLPFDVLKENITTHQEAKNSAMVLRAQIRFLWWMHAAVTRQYNDNVENSDLDIFAKESNVDSEDVKISVRAATAFDAPNWNLDTKIHELASKVHIQEKLTLDQLNIVLKQVAHDGWTFQAFKKELNKIINPKVEPEEGEIKLKGKSAQFRFHHPDLQDYDESTHFAEMDVAYEVFKGGLKGDYATAIAQLPSQGMFE